MEGLTVLLDSSSAPLRAKALVTLALLARLSPTWLLTAFRRGILTQVCFAIDSFSTVTSTTSPVMGCSFACSGRP